MSIASANTSTPNVTHQQPLKVMVVDDFVVIRGMISRWIASEPDMVVAASLRTGLDAVNQLERVDPDVAVLDIEMPDLDGIQALPLLLAKKRNLIVIMASTLTRRNAEISFKALSLGASDYIPKPESTRAASAADVFHHDLIQKIRTFGAKVRRAAQTSPGPRRRRSSTDCVKRCRVRLRPRPFPGRTSSAGASAGGGPPRLRSPGSARPSDRIVDRRPAGADGAGGGSRPGDRSLSRC